MSKVTTRVPAAFCLGLVDFCCCEACGDKCPDYRPLFSDIMSATCSDSTSATKRRKTVDQSSPEKENETSTGEES